MNSKPEKMRARYETRKAIRKGKLKISSCEVCGEARIEVHHMNYSNPLDVKFLCRKHHNQWHRENKCPDGFAELVYIPISRGARMDLKLLAAHKGMNVKQYIEYITTIEYDKLKARIDYKRLNNNNGLHRKLVKAKSYKGKVAQGRKRI